MKFLSCLHGILVIALITLGTSHALADEKNVLSNGDFSNGKANWSGDVKDASEADVTNITASMDNQTKASGMVLTLKPHDWTKVSQTFNTREAALAFVMKYVTSADFAETAPQSQSGGQAFFLANLSTLLGIPLQQDNHPPGRPGMNNGMGGDKRPFVGIVIADLSQNTVFYRYVPFSPDPNTPQTAKTVFHELMAHEEKSFYAFFPPGTGTITFSTISLSKVSAPDAPSSDRPFAPGGGVPPGQ